MIRSIFLLVCLLFASGASAQTITVRAGEHSNFTRVVLPLPQGIDWQLGRTETGYSLRLSEPVNFSTEGFFSIIPKDRIGAVNIAENQTDLSLDLACECRANAYLTDTRWLVIDVSNGAPDPTSLFEAALETGTLGVSTSDLRPTSRPETTPTNSIASESSPDEEDFVEVDLPIISEPSTPNQTISESQLLKKAEQSDRLRQLEEAVAASLGRAVTQGLLEPADTPEASSGEEDLSALQQLLADVAKIQGPGIEARTSLDVGLGLGSASIASSENSVQCGRAVDYNIAAWGSEEPFTEQLADRRNGLLGEFDRPNTEAIEALARLYLFFAFGREASSVLNIDGFESTQRNSLNSIAAIMDGDPPPHPEFVELMQCDGPMSFWAMLAHENGPLPYAVDGNSITSTFRDLPFHLQEHLAPRVAEQMRQSGDTETARIILQAALQGTVVSEAAEIEKTNLLLANGEPEKAVSSLEEIVRDDGRSAPETFLQLVELKIKEGMPISDQELEQIETLKFESVDPKVQTQLSLTNVKALEHMGKYSEALARLNESRPNISQSEYQSLRTQILGRFVDSSKDVEFLNVALDGNFVSEPADLQNQAAQRLLELGFLDEADEVISKQAVGVAMTERRYIRAEISSARGDDERVKAQLAGVETSRAREILERSGDVAPSQPASVETAWRESDWATLSEVNDPLLNSTAEYAMSAPNNPFSDASPLQSSEELIAESADLRQTVSDLLERFEIP